MLLSVCGVAHAAWPIPLVTTQVWGPESNGFGNIWCGRYFHGSFGNYYIGEVQTWVSYGGTCNGMWGRPAGDVSSQTFAFGPTWPPRRGRT